MSGRVARRMSGAARASRQRSHGMKLSELLKKLNDANLKPEDIEDDETGKPLKDLRASQKAYTQETQKRAELEKFQKEAQGRFGEYDNAIKQWQQHAATLEQQV